AHVGDEADAHLGHADLGPLGDDAVAAVTGQADAAAHHDAVHDHHVRLGVAADQRVEDVFVAPEPAGGRIGVRTACLGVGVDGHDVAAGAQAALTGAGDDDGADLLVVGPGAQRLGDGQRHRVVQRVDRLGTVERDQAEAVALVDQNLGFRRGVVVAHAAPTTVRATTTRMISLVPSRIWCTRRSRTIFSSPYSAR